MSTTTTAIDVLPDAVQVALRVPVILIGLAGVVLALVSARRLGVKATVFAVLGSGLLALDQISNIAWSLVLSAMAKDTSTTSDDFNGVTNLFTILDVVLVTIGLGFVVVALLVRRPADRKAPASVPPSFAAPGFPVSGQPQPGYPPAPGYGVPAQQPGYPSSPISPSGYPGSPPEA